ncbi:YbaB/EbfC family nucleoid-associated protein [Phytomonospora endophytica]|uniref:DNA-binding protein YbaB n=1 Tax=Phytomonospora endophytica TaxID=714109 RepID=A0A841FZK4_9ACTN|nr:YbaB/EbfC family nucleoid-associated protein [Phytomonospora endophytica]MBB6039138.1 DNA-binding protein YbaB [Phytomonospora endophytica]GIG67625.1 hypothetical protein Pen01_39200 [Phytomonospora endophytica]
MPADPSPTADAVHAAFARLRESRYTGSDDGGLATVTVDGDGLVQELEFGTAVQRKDTEAISAAVLAAVDAAEKSRTDALLELAERFPAPPRETGHE